MCPVRLKTASGVGPKRTATLDVERDFFSSGIQLVAGMDEVGRGSLAGPVGVGVAFVPAGSILAVDGLTDSKALSEKKRTAMVTLIDRWCATAVGYASPAEIDALGMTCALRLAGQRALCRAVATAGASPEVVLLDGRHDWLSPPVRDDGLDLYTGLLAEAWGGSAPWRGAVKTVVRGDYRCASIAAASVVAKVDRDRLMGELDHRYSAYEWAKNKGYGSVSHRRVLSELGPSVEHRLTWNLGVDAESVRKAYVRRAAGVAGEG